ncbi:MAG: hypothetical protein H0W09_07055 [Solirubrobacterales bacterium]|nr:hypothetical protein [Solirubrobacterales bacterium]
MPGERPFRVIVALLALMGLAIATYIAISEAGGGVPVCFAGSGGCETVAASRYSELAGVNVALLGIAGYLAIGVSSLGRGDIARFGGMALRFGGASAGMSASGP